jgi:Ca2+-binding RTX toxin-like protein
MSGIKKLRPEDEDIAPRPNLLSWAAEQKTVGGVSPEPKSGVVNSVSLGDSDSLTYSGSQSWKITGGAEANTIGTGSGNDTVFGGDGNDNIQAGNGNNSIDAGADNDTVYAGNGNDRVTLGSGSDVFWGWGGNDFVDGGSGNDYIGGGNEVGQTSRFSGGTGNDQLSFSGGFGNGQLDGGNGNDWIGISTGHVIAIGGSGADTFYFTNNGPISAAIADFSTKDGDVINLQSLGTWSYDPKTGVTLFDAIGLENVSLTVEGDLDLGSYGQIDLPLLGQGLDQLVNAGALVFGSDWSYSGGGEKG